jgi:hypothetical protein
MCPSAFSFVKCIPTSAPMKLQSRLKFTSVQIFLPHWAYSHQHNLGHSTLETPSFRVFKYLRIQHKQRSQGKETPPHKHNESQCTHLRREPSSQTKTKQTYQNYTAKHRSTRTRCKLSTSSPLCSFFSSSRSRSPKIGLPPASLPGSSTTPTSKPAASPWIRNIKRQ